MQPRNTCRCWQNKELLEIARQTLETSQKQLEQVAAQVEVGSVPQVDQYNQEATVATNELTVIQRENTLEQSKLTLIRTLQLDPTGSFEFQIPDINEENVTPRQYNLQELTEQALASRSDLEAQRQTIESNRYNLQMARWSLYPSISASFSLGSSYQDLYRGLEVINGQPRQIIVGFGDQFFDQRVGRSVGFSVNIPIFSNWNTRLSVQQAQVTYKNSQLSLENQRYGVMEEVRQAYSDYTSYRKQLQSSSVALRAAQRSFETQQQRYNVGAGTLIELSSAQQSYTQAQADHANALYRLIFQEQLLEYYLGQMDTDIQLQN
ncbi:MAG: TolC family protein [Balneolaceae bacterium]|nr:TolC family protein [Balneolaceae bacterium]